MLSESSFTTFETLPPGGRIHILGAGPVGLLLAALLQSLKGVDVHLYEKRKDVHAHAHGPPRAVSSRRLC